MMHLMRVRHGGILGVFVAMVGLLGAAGVVGAEAPASGDQVDPRRITPVVEAFRKSKDAVVNIASTHILEVRQPFWGMDLFDMPGPAPRRRVERTSVGSGFVIHPAGYIITNAHVVVRTAERKAIFADGAEHSARIIATDTDHDLALLKIDTDRPLQPITLGTSGDLMVGETVIAIGNPFGYEHTVTAGVVSALERTLQVSENHQLTDLIQTDASINPGNSGGPLLNILGQLVGVNTAIRADANNIGFAIPADRLRELLPAMLDVQRRYGIVTGLTVERAPEQQGVRIAEVVPDSPADDADLETGHIITNLAGQPVASVIDFHIALIDRAPGQTLTLTLDDGSTARLTLAERPRPDGAKLLKARFGLTAQPITDDQARQSGIPQLEGLRITDIEPASPASRLRLREGDVLLQIGRHQPTNMAELGELLEQVESGDRVRIVALRIQGRTIYRFTATIEAR